LAKDDRVVVHGLQRARPGAAVKPVLQEAAATAQPGAPAASSPQAMPTAR
jgi:hypothetical protein